MRKTDPAVQQYLADAQSWEIDLVTRAQASERRAWAVAKAAGGIAALAVLAVAGLTPLKEPVTAIVRVNTSAGAVDIVPHYEGTTEIPEVVTRNLLQHYVSARERYAYGVVEADYDLVAAHSSPALNQEMARVWDQSNEQSPLNLYKDGTVKRVEVTSTTFLKLGSGREDVAQVRFNVYTRPGGTASEPPPQSYIATVEFAYTKPAKDNKVRALNPLGFRVLSYRLEPDLTAPAAPAAPSTAAAAPGTPAQPAAAGASRAGGAS